jgi:arylsulfatase
MLSLFDDAMGKLDHYLTASGQYENTLVVFLSDNGGYALIEKYNAGMRGGKSRLYEGGHRVPCFIRWATGGIGGKERSRDVSGLTQVQDLCPTILGLTNSKPLNQSPMNGIDLSGPLRGTATVPDRTLIVQYGVPEAFRMTCVMQGPWRLLTDIKGTAQGAPELYRLDQDPQQTNNLIEVEREKAAKLRLAYDEWWNSVEPATQERVRVHIGTSAQPVVQLSCSEWRENALSSIEKMRQGVKRRGVWDVDFRTEGQYRIGLRRWPHDAGLRLTEGAPAWYPRDQGTPDHIGYAPGNALPIAWAELRIGEQTVRHPIDPTKEDVEFQLHLPSGKLSLEGVFFDTENRLLCGAYFATVEKLDKP